MSGFGKWGLLVHVREDQRIANSTQKIYGFPAWADQKTFSIKKILKRLKEKFSVSVTLVFQREWHLSMLSCLQGKLWSLHIVKQAELRAEQKRGKRFESMRHFATADCVSKAQEFTKRAQAEFAHRIHNSRPPLETFALCISGGGRGTLFSSF